MDLLKLSGIMIFIYVFEYSFFTIPEVNANWSSDVNMQMAFKMPTVHVFWALWVWTNLLAVKTCNQILVQVCRVL